MRKTRENRFNLVCCEVKQGINHFYHTHTQMNIFSRLIATSQTPPLSGGSTRSDFERLLDLRNLWSVLTFFLRITQLVECFSQWRKHPSKCTKIDFFPSDSRARKHRRCRGVMNRVACLCSFWCNAFAVNARLEPLLVHLCCPLLCRCYQT